MGDRVLPFAGYWIINSLVLWILSLIWPGFVVFGNANFAPVVAIIWTGFLLTIVITVTQPALQQLKIKTPKEYQMGVVFLVVNVVALWILARWVQPVTGFGIGAFYVAIVLGIITNFAQWGFWKLQSKKQQPAKKTA